jgi:D-alanyl-D-alanine carboxypeptidase
LPRFLGAIADMNSNCDDLLRFFKAIVSGQLFRDRRTWRRMQARWHRFPLPLDRAALRQPGWPIEYSLGLMRFRLPGFLTPLRSVPPVLGHTGSTGTWLFRAPGPDLYLTGTVNQITAGAVPFRVAPEVLRVIAV